MTKTAKLPVIFGENRPNPESPVRDRAGAMRLANKMMPADLKRAGFSSEIFHANTEDHGWSGYRISYSKRVAS